MKVFCASFLVLFLFAQSFGAGGRCGTMQFIENSKNPKKKALAKEGCIPESFYGEVSSEQTEHFIIYYAKDGLHAAKSKAYIDSLAKHLERAYKLHKDSLGMKNIFGASQTWHYRQRVPAGLYPVEVIDIGLFRGYEGEYNAVFGMVFSPDGRYPKRTQMVMENDFMYGANCSGAPSRTPFISWEGTNYSVRWDLALRVTTFHELYHSFQTAQFNAANGAGTFWLEASATGVEDIGAPDVNDYIGYLRNVFGDPGRSMEAPKEQQEYGHAPLYLFLHSKLGPKFDSYIWDSFSKYPKEKFAMHLASLADSLGLNAEELYHEYARSVFFSGRRASAPQAPDYLFWPDHSKWPAWATSTMIPQTMPNAAINFIKAASKPNTDSANISLLNYGDSSVWVLSRLLEKEFVPLESLASPPKFAAYPNPWNPKSGIPLKFRPLSEDGGVEIRAANGALLERIRGKEGETLIWQPKKLPAPGILYYRALPYGKNKVLIAEW